jgi:integrase/recombinase XerD
MLRTLLPKVHHKFLSMPLLGPITDGFDDWLADSGFTRGSRKSSIRMLRHVDADLRHRRIKHVSELTHQILNDCWKNLINVYPCRAGTVHTLERYLIAIRLIPDDRQAAATLRSPVLSETYVTHLRDVRGFASFTIASHRRTAECFLRHLKKTGIAVGSIKLSNIESYISKIGSRLSRGTIQHEVAALRGFLRFLAMEGKVPVGLDCQIDTPRLYRLEQLPRAISWETVRTLLQSVDRTSPMGLRDYAIFLLIATYGLRASEIVEISLDDIRWRQRILRIHQRKTSEPLELPLTNEVIAALVKHLKQTPPPPPYRRLFLQMRAPMGVLKPTAVSEAFQALIRKSGLGIPCQGAPAAHMGLPHAGRRSGSRLRVGPARPLESVYHFEDLFALGSGHAPCNDGRARQRKKCKQPANADRK